VLGLWVNRVVIILAIPLLAYLGVSTARKALEVYQLRQQAGQIQQEIDRLEARNVELRRQIEYLKSSEYLEKAAREELGLVKEGDVPVVVVSPREKEPPAEAPPRPLAPPTPNWQRWWDFFFAQGS
jgi:cell division protein DivIC